jgi:anaerobic magnesium-protoporphyrin IX monomethyl ester cyclase
VRVLQHAADPRNENPGLVERARRGGARPPQAPTRQVSFVDDVFTSRPGGGARKLCELMIQADLDLTWYCNVRADQVTPRIASTMKEAGCHQVFMGFESGCDDMLRRIHKGERVADLERGAATLKAANIRISIGFIVGLPGETDDSVRKSIDLCNRVRPDRVQFTRFTPIPGSQLAERLHSQVGTLNGGKGFHDRSSKDQVEKWIQMCYDSCQYNPFL